MQKSAGVTATKMYNSNAMSSMKLYIITNINTHIITETQRGTA